jgi:hypothetical protein
MHAKNFCSKFLNIFKNDFRPAVAYAPMRQSGFPLSTALHSAPPREPNLHLALPPPVSIRASVPTLVLLRLRCRRRARTQMASRRRPPNSPAEARPGRRLPFQQARRPPDRSISYLPHLPACISAMAAPVSSRPAASFSTRDATRSLSQTSSSWNPSGHAAPP